MRYFRILLISLFLLLLSFYRSEAQQIAVKTDALKWLALTPNAGVEIVTGEHGSVDLSLFGHSNPYGLTSKMFSFQPEYRYWFNGRPMIREYIGAAALLTTYDSTFARRVYNGDAAGLGITGGYIFSLGKRWNLDLSAGFGVLYFHQKQYYINDNYDDFFAEANAWGYKLFPVRIGVTFSYIIK